jgi:hypothetical protein
MMAMMTNQPGLATGLIIGGLVLAVIVIIFLGRARDKN